MTPTPRRDESIALPRARSNEQCIQILEAALKRALDGDLVACLFVGESVNGTIGTAFTECEDVFKIGGAAIAAANRRMGFALSP